MPQLATAIGLTLKPTVHAAMVDEHLVLLDIAADAYSCMAVDGGAALQADGRTLHLADEDLAQDLLTTGLADRPADAGAAPPRPRAPPPRASAIRTAYPHPSVRDLCDEVIALQDLLANYRGRSLAQILRIARAGAAVPTLAPTPGLLRRVERFHTWLPYVDAVVECFLALSAGRTVRSAGDCRRAGR